MTNQSLDCMCSQCSEWRACSVGNGKKASRSSWGWSLTLEELDEVEGIYSFIYHALIYQWLFIKCFLRVRHCRQCTWRGHSLGGGDVLEQKAALGDWPWGLRWGKIGDKAGQAGRETTRGDLGAFLYHSPQTNSSLGRMLNITMGS